MKPCFLAFLILPFCGLLVDAAESGKHLFILSGQSNMARLDPAVSFTPTVEAAFGKDKVIVVKDAKGGQPIRRWYKGWKVMEGENPNEIGDLYERLMGTVKAAIEGEKLASVTFLWMQGERDAKESKGEFYKTSLLGLLAQVETDLKRDDVNFVVGRLSDCDLENQGFPHWTLVRQVQVELAGSRPRSAWVDTDDLNDGVNAKGKEIKNDLHYTEEGYKEFGKRLADAAIGLIKEGTKQ